MFGLWNQAPVAGPAWGARTILTRGEFDLLWDRQTGREAGKGFLAKVNAALPAVREAVRGARLPQDTTVTTLYVGDGLVVKGSTNGSYGYLYLIAYPAPD